MKIEITKDPYYEGDYIFDNDLLELKENSITCFVGCNGSGKTTLLHRIRDYLKKDCKTNEIKHDFYGHAFDKAVKILFDEDDSEPDLYFLDFDKDSNVTYTESDYFMNAAGIAYSSTGEGIVDRLGKNMQLLGSTIKDLHDTKLIIFFDDCDAGTSIDMINEIKNVLKHIINTCKKQNITYYILLTSNSYEMARDLNCVSVHDFSEQHFKDYEDYKQFVLKSRERKNKRFKEND